MGHSPQDDIHHGQDNPLCRSIHSVAISGLEVRGNKGNGGSGHGFHNDNSAQPSLFELSNLFISDMGGKGIYDLTGFSSKYRDIFITNCEDHGIEGNFTILDNVYAGDIPTAGKCGFRVYNSPVMIGCNGVNSGDYWGIFGATIALDGFLSYSSATLIGCNVEDFEVCGILCRDGSSPNFQGHTTILAPSTGTVMAVQLQGGTNRVPFWEGLDLSTKGASWTDGYAIHAQGAPCISMYQNASSPIAFYHDGDDQIYTIPSISDQYVAAYTRGVGLNAAWIGGADNNIRVDANGEMTFHGTASIDGVGISAEGSAPTTGTYKQGAVVFNKTATSGQPAGWMCVTTGTFSAYSTTGTTDGLTGTVTSVGSTAAVSVNDYVTIATTTNGPFRVLSKTSNTLVVTPVPDAAGVGVAIATSDPTFKAMGNLA